MIDRGVWRHTDKKDVLKDNDDEAYLILKKSIYGLVQAACQFHKKLISTLIQETNFIKYAGDKCLLMRKKTR